jgi:hypothetical protein
MTSPTFVAGVLLVAGPVVGAIPVAHPALMRVWSAPRERYLEIIGAHRRAWYLLNAGFSLATISTAAGLAIMAASADPATARGALLMAVTVAYAMGGVLWLAALAIRSLRDPLLADMLAEGRATEPAESMLGAATTGLFIGFVLTTAVTLLVLAVVLGLAGGVAVPVAVIGGVIAGFVLANQLRTGDTIPAILYLPTLLIGVALLAGWT